MVSALRAQPDVSYPDALGNESDLEGFYRLLGNETVTPEAILTPHRRATMKRAAASTCTLVIHDSTDIAHGSGKA